MNWTRLAALLGAVLLILSTGPALSADDLTARLLTRGPLAPGQELEIQVEVSWEGRPERAAPGVPTITVPDGAGLRLGRTGSSFDGQRSKWWTDGIVTLPDQSRGPWTVGPVQIPVALPGGGSTTLVAPSKRLGSRPRRNLLGQGLASAVVLAIAAAALLWLTRRARVVEQSPTLAELVTSLRAALDGDEPLRALDEALALHARLAEHRIARDYLPPEEGLRAERQAAAFGGHATSMDAVRPLARPLLTIADTVLK